MRLSRLELIRYGKFTDRVLDFGPKPETGPDLHVIYGPNEAGKSTLFAGLLDFLYGIPAQTPYGFQHDYGTLRIAGVVEAEGRARRFVRVKKQAGLLDDQDQVLPEMALKGLLGGIEREDYRVMFSLDGDTLKKGGRDILASKGSLGELLFAGGSGLADLSAKLAALEEELNAFQKPGGRTGRLTELRRSAEALKTRQEEADVSVRDYGDLDGAVATAAAADAGAAAAHREASDRLERIRLLLDALTLRDAHGAAAEEAQAAARKAAETADMLAHAAQADALADLAGAHRKALEDLPNRRTECAAAEMAVRDLLAQLRKAEEAEPERLLLDVAASSALRQLIGRKAAIDATLESARKAAASAARVLAEGEAALAAAGGATGPELARVRRALEAWRAGSPAKALELARKAAAKARTALDDALEALHPWTGDAEALAAIDAPESVDVAAAGVAVDDAAKADQRARQALERAGATVERHSRELAALGDPAALRDGADHPAVRAAREAAWAAHRKTLDAATAGVFEDALRRDDAATESRLTLAGALARAAELRVALAAAEAELKQAQRVATTAAADVEEARAAFATLVAAVSPAFKPTMSAQSLTIWLKRRDEGLRYRRELRDAERDAATASADGERLRAGLRAALDAAGVDVEDEALPDAAEALLSGADAAAALGASLERAARAAADSRAGLDAALNDASAWDQDWRQALAACWLGGMTPVPDPALVADILELLGRLKAALEMLAERRDRMAKLEREIAVFGGQVAALATAAGLPADGDPLTILRAIIDRIVMARDAADRRDRLGRDAATAERSLLLRLGVGTLAQAEEMLTGVDAPALRAEQADLAIRLPVLDTARLESFSALSAARRALDAVGGDARAARLAGERANVLLQMGEEATHHLSLRLGIMAMRQALRRYRDLHRSSMLESASSAFAVMTQGAYTGLAAQGDGGVEKLIALAREGGSREADQLSTGTQYQLFLALRVAGHAEFARERQPLPFVCDDIFETFDDLRAEEALRLLSGMALHGQVICLTHHRHLCAIARQVCPQARLLEL